MLRQPAQTRRCFLRQATFSAAAVLAAAGVEHAGPASDRVFTPAHAGKPNDDLEFIDASFENASPLWYDVADDSTITSHLSYDHERASPNRAAGHIHFQLQARPGSRLMLEFRNLDNISNGRSGSVAKELGAVVVSTNGVQWQSLARAVTANGRVRLAAKMPGPRLFVARVEPYGVPDLERLLSFVRRQPLARIKTIGKTVEGRTLEIVRVGNPKAPHRVFLRARAHPWESGGSWVVQGLIRRILNADADAKKFLQRYCVYVVPMANSPAAGETATAFMALCLSLTACGSPAWASVRWGGTGKRLAPGWAACFTSTSRDDA